MAKIEPYFEISDKELKRAVALIVSSTKELKLLKEYERYVLLTGDFESQTVSMRIANTDGGMRIMLNEDGVLTSAKQLEVKNNFEFAVLVEDLDVFVKFLEGMVSFKPIKGKTDTLSVTDGQILKELRHSPSVIDTFPSDISDRLSEQFSFDAADLDRRMRLAMGSANEKLKLHKYGALYFGLIGTELFLASFDPATGLSTMRYSPSGLEVTGTSLLYILSGNGAYTVIRAIGKYEGRVAIHGSAEAGQVGFVFGGTSISCRLFEPPFLDMRIVESLKVETEATVGREALKNVLGLITKTAEKSIPGKARITFNSGGAVRVESLGKVDYVSSSMSGLASGVLPNKVDVSSARMLGVVDDLKGDLVHIGIIAQRGWLWMASPKELGYLNFQSNLVGEGEASFEENLEEAA